MSLTWQYGPGNAVEILWTESEGPEVPAERIPGFGSVVLEKTIPRSLNAAVDLDFRRDGLHCRISIPAAQLAKPDRPEHFPADAR